MSELLFKDAKVKYRYRFLCPLAQTVLQFMKEYCAERNQSLLITETVTTKFEDEQLKRVSDSHRTGRAFDVSIKEWSEQFIGDFCEKFENDFKAIAATTKNGEKKLIVRHDSGHGDHLHVQLNRQFAVDPKIDRG